MDRLSWLAITLCGLLVAGLLVWQQNQPEPAPVAAPVASVAPATASPSPAGSSAPGVAASSAPGAAAVALDPDNLPALQPSGVTLENLQVRYHFATRGGGIAVAEMITDGSAVDPTQPVRINHHGRNAVGALSVAPGEFELADYTLEKVNERQVVARGLLDGGVEVRKTWTLPDGDPGHGHLIRLDVDLTAPAGTTLSRNDLGLGLGSISALQQSELPSYTTVAWQHGGHHESEGVQWFDGSKFLWMFPTRAPSNLLNQSGQDWWWAAVMNQFYTTMASPVERPGQAEGRVWAERTPPTFTPQHWGIEAATGLGQINLAAGNTQRISYEFYLGPKNYTWLKELGGERSEVLDYGGLPIFGWMAAPASKVLSTALNHIAMWFVSLKWNWAWAIIALTILIRTLMWPLNARAQRTMKRMSKLKPEMDALKEKYPDDPQKVQQESMKLWGQYGINPMGGCLPMLIQMPIFLGFYRMLFFAAELRHERFLWVKDLSQPDTVATIAGIPINPLPLVMTVFTLLQFKLTPKTGDLTQRRMMYFMPVVMLFFSYNFASALALYWTVSNIFSIVQMVVMQRLPEPELKKVKRKTMAERLEEMQAQRAQMSAGRSGNPAPKERKPRPRTGG